jgi:DNA-directed RNA polymerase specialized sigma24 family protein
VLNQKFPLHDLEDTEALCVWIIDRSGLELGYHEREDLLTFLIETAWELSERYEAGGIAFSTWATTTLKRRVHDWQRGKYRTKWQFQDRTYEREPPCFTVLEDRPDIPVHTEPLDAGLHSGPALRGLLRERGSEPARGDQALCEGADSEAA